MLSIHSIELTNYCNLKCSHCPNSNVSYPNGYISLNKFLKALNYSKNIGLSVHGEPFLHPQACEFIRIAKKYIGSGIVNIHTNGTLLTESICTELIDSKIDSIEISIHTEKSLIGFKRLFEINESLRGTLKITGNILICYENEFRDWIKKVGIEKKHLSSFRLLTMHNWACNPPSTNNYKDKCLFINNDWCVVKWDGKIYSCCFDFDGANYIGEIEDFPNLNHKKDYKLCKSCSPSWATQSDPAIWYSITESFLNKSEKTNGN